MSTTVQCPGCGKKLKASDQLAGKRVKCPECGHVMVVPALAAIQKGVKSVQSVTPPPVASGVGSAVAAVPVPPRRRIRWPWAAAGGVGTVAIVVGISFALGLWGSAPDAATTNLVSAGGGGDEDKEGTHALGQPREVPDIVGTGAAPGDATARGKQRLASDEPAPISSAKSTTPKVDEAQSATDSKGALQSNGAESTEVKPWQRNWSEFVVLLAERSHAQAKDVIGMRVEWSGVAKAIKTPEGTAEAGTVELTMDPALELREPPGFQAPGATYSTTSVSLTPTAKEWEAWVTVSPGQRVMFQTEIASAFADGSSPAGVYHGKREGREVVFLWLATSGGTLIRKEAPCPDEIVAQAVIDSKFRLGTPTVHESIEDPFRKTNPLLPYGDNMYLPGQPSGTLFTVSLHRTGKGNLNAELTAKPDEKLVVVPLAWSDLPEDSMRVGNLDFSASAIGESARRASAISVVGSARDSFWLIPESGNGISFEVNTKQFKEHGFAVAFVIPSKWERFEVSYVHQSLGNVSGP